MAAVAGMPLLFIPAQIRIEKVDAFRGVDTGRIQCAVGSVDHVAVKISITPGVDVGFTVP